MKNGKRILSVKLVHDADTDADTSYLGEYANNPTSEYSIDRKHSLDCQVNTHANDEAIEKLERVMTWLDSQKPKYDAPQTVTIQEYENLIAAQDILIAKQEELAECDCGLTWYPENEYRYFNPSSNYVDEKDKPRDNLHPAEIRKYVKQDYERMERLNRGDWWYIGIRAKAEIKLNTDDRGIGVVQTVSSGGLWGIESDSDASYIAEIEQEQISDLKRELTAIGFSKRAISKAFQNVERSE
jgi:uncharacterized protein Smg (DUF494 family)